MGRNCTRGCRVLCNCTLHDMYGLVRVHDQIFGNKIRGERDESKAVRNYAHLQRALPFCRWPSHQENICSLVWRDRQSLGCRQSPLQDLPWTVSSRVKYALSEQAWGLRDCAGDDSDPPRPTPKIYLKNKTNESELTLRECVTLQLLGFRQTCSGSAHFVISSMLRSNFLAQGNTSLNLDKPPRTTPSAHLWCHILSIVK